MENRKKCHLNNSAGCIFWKCTYLISSRFMCRSTCHTWYVSILRDPVLYDGVLGCWLPITRPYIIHCNLVNFNVKYLKNRRLGYPTCIPSFKDQSKMSRCKQKTWYVAYYARKNSARNETHHFWLLFSWISATGCLHSPPTYHHALSKKTNLFFTQMIHHFTPIYKK